MIMSEDRRLLSMVEFVDWIKFQPPTTDYMIKNYQTPVHEKYGLICKYSTFLQSELNIGMFVPAVEKDGKWVVLEMPTGWGNTNVDREMTEEDYQYQAAKDRVIFEGVEADRVNERDGGYFYLVKDSDGGNIYASWNTSKTIQDMLHLKPTLTESKYNEIYK